MSRPLRAADLVPGTVYIAPSGELVQMLPYDPRNPDTQTFRYLSDDTTFDLIDQIAIEKLQVAPDMAARGLT